MRYPGGKFRQRKQFVPAILSHTPNRQRYLEPFVGGGSMLERMAPHFEQVRASDIHEDLILMYQALKDGWEPPTEVSREDYYEVKATNGPSALRGFIGFGVSFGAKWFGGYAEAETAGRSARNLQRVMNSLPEDTRFSLKSFEEWDPQPGTVVYCDPPYRNVGKVYGKHSGFPHDEFWALMNEWVARGVHVFVSEYSAPDGWVFITESVQKRTLAGDFPEARKRNQYDRLFVPMSKFDGYGLNAEGN